MDIDSIPPRRTPTADTHKGPSPAPHHPCPYGIVSPFIALEMVNPSELRQVRPVTHMSRAAHGCEKMNIAVTWNGGRCSNPPNTSRPTASLLPTCPGGVGMIYNTWS